MGCNYRYGLRQSGVDIQSIEYLAESIKMPNKQVTTQDIDHNKIFDLTADVLKESIFDTIDNYIYEHPIDGNNFTVICFIANCGNPSQPDGQKYTYKPSIRIKNLSSAECSVTILVTCEPFTSVYSHNFNVANNFNYIAADSIYVPLDRTFTPLWRFTEGLEKHVYEELGVKLNIKYKQIHAPKGLFKYSFANDRGDTVYYNVPDDTSALSELSAEEYIDNFNSVKFPNIRTADSFVVDPASSIIIFVIKTVDDVIALEEILKNHAVNIDNNSAFGITIADTGDTDKVIAKLKSMQLPIYIKYLDLMNPGCPKLRDIDWFNDVCKLDSVIWFWGGSMIKDMSNRPWYEDATHGILRKTELAEITSDGHNPKSYIYALYKYSDGYIVTRRIDKRGYSKKLPPSYNDTEIDEAIKIPTKRLRDSDNAQEELPTQDIQKIVFPVLKNEIYETIANYILSETNAIRQNAYNSQDFPYDIIRFTYSDDNRQDDFAVDIKLESGNIVVKLILAYTGDTHLLLNYIIFGGAFLAFRERVCNLQEILRNAYSNNIIVQCVFKRNIPNCKIFRGLPIISDEHNFNNKITEILNLSDDTPFPALCLKSQPDKQIIHIEFKSGCTVRGFEDFIAEFIPEQNLKDKFILNCQDGFIIPSRNDINPKCNINFVGVELSDPTISSYDWIESLCGTPDCKIILSWRKLNALARAGEIEQVTNNTKGVITKDCILRYSKKIAAFTVPPVPFAIYSPGAGTFMTSDGRNILK